MTSVGIERRLNGCLPTIFRILLRMGASGDKHGSGEGYLKEERGPFPY